MTREQNCQAIPRCSTARTLSQRQQRIVFDQDLMHLELNLEKLVDDANAEKCNCQVSNPIKNFGFCGAGKIAENSLKLMAAVLLCTRHWILHGVPSAFAKAMEKLRTQVLDRTTDRVFRA